jgi:hypothetical protein
LLAVVGRNTQTNKTSKKEKRRGGLEKKGCLVFSLFCCGVCFLEEGKKCLFFLACCFLFPFQMPNKTQNTNTTLKPYIIAFCRVFS